MNLTHVANKILLSDLKNLVKAERESTLSILFYLKEIELRKLYSELKCTSLFDFCVRELGYSETSAKRRIVGARELAAHPEIATKIENGSLSLTNISLVNQFIKDPIVKKDVFKIVEGLSKRDCEKKLFEITGIEKVPYAKPNFKCFLFSEEEIEQLEYLNSLLGKNMTFVELIDFVVTSMIVKLEQGPPAKVKGAK